MILIIIPVSITRASYVNRINQIISIIIAVYIAAGTIRSLYFRRKDSIILSAGIIIMLFSLVNDILHYMRIINTIQTAHIAISVFILFQAAVLAVRFSRAFTENENLNRNLEKLVTERTNELQTILNDMQEIDKVNKNDLMVAQSIQCKLIPTNFPDLKNIKFYSSYLPMEALGGDLFDIYVIDKNKTACMILDVCGHGIPAALITTMAKILFSNAVKMFDNVSDIIRFVNSELYEITQNTGDYLTAFFCIIDTDLMNIKYINAGHSEIILIKDDGKITLLKNNTIFIGVMKALPCDENTIDLKGLLCIQME